MIEYILLLTGMFLKEGLYVSLGYVLLRQWIKSEKRYYSDLPFLLGLAFSLMAVFSSFDVLWVLYIVPYETFANQILIVIQYAMMTVVIVILFISMMNIWFEKKPKLRKTVISVWSVVIPLGFFIGIFLNYEIIMALIAFFALPTFLLLGVTFLFAYSQKRLGNIHPLYVGIGALIGMLSYVFHMIFTELGVPYVDIYTTLSFIGLFIECLAYSGFLVGFLKQAPY